ncbi:NUDIX hydrolase [Candidatus Peregrinibacteria bacterium]|nr:MAG: NUDIX hydrolase [Candidatus Peregrinibacteria bacterium]
MKKDHPYVGAANIFVGPKGELLLMKRSQKTFAFPGYWGLVGGFLEWGETAAEAAIREAKEEIGVDIEVIRFTGKYYNTPSPNKGRVISLPHYSVILSGSPYPAQPEECEEVRWFNPDEVKAMELAYDHKQILKDEGLIE